MKKTVFILFLVTLSLLLLCGCEGVNIELDTTEPVACVFDLSYDETQGTAWVDSQESSYMTGDSLTVHATGVDGKDFMCWTTGTYLEDGGTDISHDPDYTFVLEGDTHLYCNYKNSSTAMVLYHLNGGTVADTGEDTYLQEFSLEYYLYPNSIASMGTFVREGYTLIEYNTEPDGSGEAFNIGGKILIETNRIIDVYCIWSEQSKESDFTFAWYDSLNGYYVTGYKGKDDMVSIPDSYEGFPVVGIAAGALTGCEMSALVIPTSVKYVQDFSCNSCENLTTLYIFDSLTYISDDSFDSCDNLRTYCFNAATAPRYTTWFNNHTKKIEVLVHTSRTADKPRIICVGGSSTTYAIDCEHMEECLDEDYMVINFGSNGANLFNMTAWWVMKYMNPGDIVLQFPEYSSWQLGGVVCRWETFRSFEGCYNVFRWINGSKFYNFLDCFCEFLQQRSDMEETSYEDYTCTLAPNGYYNNQGTLNVHVRGSSETFWGGRTITLCDNYLYSYMVSYCNYIYKAINYYGGTALMGWTPLNINAMKNSPDSQEVLDFEEYMNTNFNITKISDIHDYFYTGDYFFDDDYHLSYESRLKYTEQVAADLNTWFASQTDTTE